MLYCGASCSSFWSSISAHHQVLGFSSLAFFLSASLLFKFQHACHLGLSALPVHSPPSSTNLWFLCASPLRVIFHSKSIYSPLHLVSHFLLVFLPVPWTIFSGFIQMIDSACTALSYCHVFLVLLQQQLTPVGLLPETLQNLSFIHWTFFQALIWRLHFVILLVSLYWIVFWNSLHNTFCFSKTLLCHFVCLSPVISLLL